MTTRIGVATRQDECGGPLVNLSLTCSTVGVVGIDLTLEEAKRVRKNLRRMARQAKREARS